MKALQAQSEAGVVFDPYYTDSLFRIIGNKANSSKLIRTRRALPRKEILTNLLLFGHAYLSRPYWLTAPDLPDLGILEREGLASWIPTEYYGNSLDLVEAYTHYLMGAFGSLFNEASHLSIEAALDSSGELRPDRWSRELNHRSYVVDERLDLLSFTIRQIFYNVPLITSCLSHSRLNLKDAEEFLVLALDTGSIVFIQDVHLPERVLGETLSDWAAEDISFSRRVAKSTDLIADLLPDSIPQAEAIRLLTAQAATLDASLTTLTIENFAGDKNRPIKANSQRLRHVVPPMPLRFPDRDLYKLMQVQFKHLRYPVIETVEDVLRLREDPHLRNYREVIFGYSQNLQADLEGAHVRVLEKFKHDLELALADLGKLRRWSTYLDITFYLSIPLAIAGILTGLPLSDIVSIPVGGLAKMESIRKRRKLGWILFGRPERAA